MWSLAKNPSFIFLLQKRGPFLPFSWVISGGLFYNAGLFCSNTSSNCLNRIGFWQNRGPSILQIFQIDSNQT